MSVRPIPATPFRQAIIRLIALVGTAAFSHSGETPTAEGIRFFETHIRPSLVEHCYSCHSEKAEKIKGGLLLDTRDGARKGGETGPAVVPGDLEKSLLIQAIRYTDEDTAMPPKRGDKGGKLPDAVIANFERWIRMGAPDPREGVATVVKKYDLDDAKSWWSFQPVMKRAVPQPKDASWPRSDIDRFILSALEERGLKPSADADPATLLRRVTFDLTGLPPTPDEVESFVTECAREESGRASALERVIDRLLDSPRFGERWGRHWLDVARYAETSGKAVNVLYANAWRYRDYVIASFNADKPYDQFLKEQIAGDLLPFTNERDLAEKIIATGFLAIGTKSHDELDRAKFLMDVADEQIDTVTQAMLGLSVACARCHDHKHDPVSQRDYYALAGIFLSSETMFGTTYRLQNWHSTPHIEMPARAALPSALSPINAAEVKALDQSAIETRRAMIAAASNPQSTRFANQKARVEESLAKAKRELYNADGTPRTFIMGVLDRDRPSDSHLLVRGEVSQPAEIVPRGFVRVLSPAENRPITKGSGRLQLAEFIASRENPLTARVMVNRVWSKLFGRGIVATPDNFGRMGDLPSHPELLDHLAQRFVESGWSVKRLIREVMLSRAYQQSSAYDAKNDATDPDNQLLWRMSRRRLDAEAIRDAMLFVSGSLDLNPVAGSIVARLEEPHTGSLDLAGPVESVPQKHRSIYLPIVRGQPPAALACFDFPDPSAVCGQRNATNVPAQSLYLMNNPFVLTQGDAFAARIAKRGGSVVEQAEHAFKVALSRDPSVQERAAIADFIKSFPSPVPEEVLAAYCQSLFASGEFRYLN